MILNTNPRRIIVCLDGTWYSPAEKTNVYKFYTNCLDNNEIDDDGYKNLKGYFPGVGTDWYNRLRGGMCGYGIAKQIKDAYEYISTNYRDNKDDKIYLIGFSRGAYAARSIIGMINNVGLLHPENLERIDEAYELYRNRNDNARPHGSLSTSFSKNNNSRYPTIHFLGCFDTVGSLGVPKLPWYLGGSFWYSMFLDLHEFHDTELSSLVKHAYHVLSIHDQRKWFQPTLMQLSAHQNFQEQQKSEKTIHQLWFPGMHGDVGGQKETSSQHNNLISSRTLDWMMLKASENGLRFKPHSTISCPEAVFIESPDSYRNIYKLVPREDRVIPEDGDVDTCGIPIPCYHRDIIRAGITPKQMKWFKSNTLNRFQSQTISA